MKKGANNGSRVFNAELKERWGVVLKMDEIITTNGSRRYTEPRHGPEGVTTRG